MGEIQKNLNGISGDKIRLALTLAGVVVVLLNIWLVAKLAPIATDLAVISGRVDANEVRIVPRDELEIQFNNIEGRLDRIENKLDRLIER